MKPRTAEVIRKDLILGLSRAKNAIVGILLSDLRTVAGDNFRDYLGMDYEEAYLLSEPKPQRKLVLNPNTGMSHEERTERNVFVQREPLLERLESDQEKAEKLAAEKATTVKMPPPKNDPSKAA